MKIKLKFIYILIGMTIISMSSCKDWLSESPSSQLTSEELYETESGFREALIGIYIKMASEDLYAKKMTWHFADLLAIPYVKNNSTSSEPYYIVRHVYSANSVKEKYINPIWNESYQTIANINNALKNVENQSNVLNAKSKKLIKGELLGLRAYIHLDLMRMFGYGNLSNRADYEMRLTIPYVTVYSKELTPQLPYNETMSLVIKDIKEALSNLEDDPVRNLHPSSYYDDINIDGFWDNRDRRLNYYAVQALLARAYMWEGSNAGLEEAFKIASDLTKEEGTAYKWITYSDISSTNLTLVDRTFGVEHLFALDVYSLKAIFNPYMIDPEQDTYNMVSYIARKDFEESIFESGYWGKSGYYYAPNHPEADASGLIPLSLLGSGNPIAGIGEADYRLKYHFEFSSSSSMGNVYYLKKYYQPENYNDVNYRKNRIPLLKISEMYYILAEYYIHHNNESKALDILDQVRFHRGLEKKIDPRLIVSVQSELTKEYIREFSGEGQLFYYYKRLNILDPTDYGISGGYRGIENYGFNDDIFLIPYPDDEILYGNRVQ
ncbi:RagB/SusD family nutrient uptake outer membrane protein [Dysgonomonas sp. Marseille-P4677]|uniref:RagB/SusD family nutrient uptake outer membrane protein n=1 Tax=Dysgonomonas sp. Marseille-P4677 TaxID=2364790 RepID=UPI0019118A2F|nr:RagB/SusD family nutrient uptake outer membrane protein [Dysgonomonas sp. Marseille-P4677]MBK5721826.1 RagB/SusD family nutrient uptake outer membrane protein [Dysgonomonas sp. Marseille-P4677]